MCSTTQHRHWCIGWYMDLTWTLLAHTLKSYVGIYGMQVRFLSLLSQDFGDLPYLPDELTTRVLDRLARTGSLLCDDVDEEAPGGGLAGLFDE